MRTVSQKCIILDFAKQSGIIVLEVNCDEIDSARLLS